MCPLRYYPMLHRTTEPTHLRFELVRYAICNAHLLRDLVYIEEVSPAQVIWTKPLAALLIEIKEATDEARAAGREELSEETRGAYLRRYDRWVKKADRLKPHPPKRKRQPLSPTRRLVNRLTFTRGRTRRARRRSPARRCR